MKIIFLILIGFFFVQNETVYSQWVHQHSGVSTEEWENVEFLNKNTGFVCGWNAILKTTNGGENWVSKPIPFSFALRDISIIESNIIYCVGNYGRILKTTNGGENWESLFADTLAYIYACHFINKDTGWCAGARGFPNYSFLVKTTNGGITFTSHAFANISISDIYFKNSSTGIMVSGGAIWRSTNGGTNWYLSNFNFNGSGYQFNRFGIANDQYCWLVSLTRPVYRSTDFGENWDSIAYIPSNNLNINSTFFIDTNTGWVGADFGKIYKTTDGGFNWFDCSTTQPSGYISDIFFLNNDTGWAVEGNNGNIFKTTNGGCKTVSIINNISQLPKTHILYQNYPNPFNPITIITYQIIHSGFVKLVISDSRGRRVSTLVNANMSYGLHQIPFEGKAMASGVYYYSLWVDNELINVKKMLLIK